MYPIINAPLFAPEHTVNILFINIHLLQIFHVLIQVDEDVLYLKVFNANYYFSSHIYHKRGDCL